MAAIGSPRRFGIIGAIHHHAVCECFSPDETLRFMKSSIIQLIWLLEAAAVLQLGIAVLNLFLARLLNWREAISQMPLLVREVFRVHAWFISITLAIFAAMTLRFARQMADGADPVCQWLVAGIGLFW